MVSSMNNVTNNRSKISITNEQQNILAAVDERIIISFRVSSPYFLSLQWFGGNCLPIASQNKSSLVFIEVKEEDFGWYRRLISDCLNGESVFTKWVELKKRPQQPSYIAPAVCSCCRHQSPDYNPNSSVSTPSLVKPLKGGSYVSGNDIVLNARFNNATTYQWYKNDEILNGQTRDSLITIDADREDSGVYTVKATNLYSGIVVVVKALVIVYDS